MIQILIRDQAELLQIIFRIKLVLVDHRLPDDGIEEEAVGRHLPAGRRRHVSFREDEHVPIGFHPGVEMFRDQNHLPPGSLELLVVLVRKTKERLVGNNTHSVDPHCIGQVFLHFPEHLVGFAHSDGALFQPVVITQQFHAGHMDARHRRAPEIHGNPATLMGQGFPDLISAGRCDIIHG